MPAKLQKLTSNFSRKLISGPVVTQDDSEVDEADPLASLLSPGGRKLAHANTAEFDERSESVDSQMEHFEDILAQKMSKI